MPIILILIFFTGCSTIKTAFLPHRPLKKSFSKPIGVAADSNQIALNQAYRETLLREFSSVTTENALKMSVVQPQKGKFDFSQADSLLDFAKSNNLRFRAHALIWHRQLPQWVTHATEQELVQIFEDHIRTLVQHYKGKVASWDVVNEAFLKNGDYRKTIWYSAMGPSYIEKAFRIAREEDPNAKLFYNDFQLEKIGPKFNAVYRMLIDLKQKGVPIDGVGLQGHFNPKSTTKRKEISEAIKRFSALGLEIEITELDVAIPITNNSDKKQVLKIQADTYEMVAKACAELCSGITLWGLSDANSWVPGEFPGLGEATLFNEKFMPKPVYEVFKSSLE